MRNACFNLFMMVSNSVFPPHKTSTKHAMIPVGLLFLLQIKVPSCNWVGVAPSLISSSLNFKYQYQLASVSP